MHLRHYSLAINKKSSRGLIPAVQNNINLGTSIMPVPIIFGDVVLSNGNLAVLAANLETTAYGPFDDLQVAILGFQERKGAAIAKPALVARLDRKSVV